MQAQNLAPDSSGVLTGVLDPLSQITWLVSGKRKTQPCGPQGGEMSPQGQAGREQPDCKPGITPGFWMPLGP